MLFTLGPEITQFSPETLAARAVPTSLASLAQGDAVELDALFMLGR